MPVLRQHVAPLVAVIALILHVPDSHQYNDRDDSMISQDASCKALHQSNSDPTVFPTEVGSQVLDLRWVAPKKAPPEDLDKVVLALTRGQDGWYGGHVYRSENFGKPGSWYKINNELKNALDQVEKSSISEEEHELAILEMHFHADSPHYILLHGNDEFHWTTKDYGRTFTRVKSPGGILGSNVIFNLHPTNPEYVLARVRAAECNVPGLQKQCSVDLYVSTDFGGSWTSLTANSKGRISAFVDFEWGARMHADPNIANYNDKTIFATVYENEDKAPHGEWDEKIDFVRSDDFFASHHDTYVKCGNAFEIIAGKIFLAVPSDCPYDSTGAEIPLSMRGSGKNAVLYVSEDFGKTFSESCVPVKHIADKGYELRETHDGHGVYVLIDHDEEEDVEAAAPVYNLYTCGIVNATLFSLSLERVFSVDFYGQRLADWHRVESLPGVFITNQLEVGAMSVETMRMRGWKNFVETQITFNGGGHWQHLQAPETFRNEACNLCKKNEPCRLHLHGASSWVGGSDGRPSVYSHPSAPGILMASGNTGNHLDFNSDFQCTWLSRDGGYSWEDVAHGMFIYEYGDHGGLLLMARHRNEEIPSDTLFYSYDQGLCWHSVKLAEAMYLENIRVEPAGASHIFVLHGEQCEKSERWSSQGFNCTYDPSTRTRPKGVLYTIDFKQIRQDWDNCLAEDYEEWSPPIPDLCLLGHNFTFERRKRQAQCFNSKKYDRPVRSHVCGCDAEDVECDYGFFRKDYQSPCERVEEVARKRTCPALAEGSYKFSNSHLRLIHGDNCSGIKELVPDIYLPKNEAWAHHHHHRSGFSFWRFLLTTTIVIGLLSGAFVAWLKLFASEDVKDSVSEVCSPFTSFCGSSCGMLFDCFRSSSARLAGGATPTDAFFSPLAGGEGLDFDDADAHNAPMVGKTAPPGQQTMP